MKLSFSFKLTGKGWAECWIKIDNQVTVLTASYLEDALGNLAEATLQLAQGEKFAYVIFAEEPGEYCWKLDQTIEGQISVEIRWFNDWKEFRQDDEKGQIILQFDCALIVFVRRIIACLSKVLNEYGLEGYKNTWSMHEFPLKTYNDLRQILQKMK